MPYSPHTPDDVRRAKAREARQRYRDRIGPDARAAARKAEKLRRKERDPAAWAAKKRTENRLAYLRNILDDAFRAKLRAYSQSYYARHRERVLARQRSAYQEGRGKVHRRYRIASNLPPTHVTFPACAAPSPARDLLLAVRRAVRGHEADEIAAEALLIITEHGGEIASAVAEARRRVWRNASPLYRAASIDDMRTL